MSVLVTGGAGYIGSHACLRLLRGGHDVVVLDNLVRGHAEAVDAVREATGASDDRLAFVEGDIADADLVGRAIRERGVTSVMHFAALAYVGESVDDPLRYWENNTAGAIALLGACHDAGVERFIFSSTCASYGEPPAERIPIREDCPQHPINPYGWSKLAFEHALADYAEARRRAGEPFACARLRYFNVAGCDPDGAVGEDHDPETHLIPVVLQAAMGTRDAITIFGTDYDTPDGTCVRDYIHVSDLVDAHAVVLEALDPAGDERVRTYNLGIGRGYSVREIVDAAKRVTGVDFEVREGERRAGDPPTLFADARLIARELGWAPKHKDVEGVIETAWNWFRAHPGGYGG